MTGSEAKTISGGGKGLASYIYGILAKKYALSDDEESYLSQDMQRGIDKEGQARDTYELHTGNEVEQVGFIEMDEYTGVSPDGIIGSDGGFEAKCVNNKNFFCLLVDGEKIIPDKFLWQVQMCLLVSGRKWWDLCFWNGNFSRNLIIFRIVPDMIMQEKLMVGLAKGKNLIIKLEEEYAKRNS